METESKLKKIEFILSAVYELADLFYMRLTDATKNVWVEELEKYPEDIILKTKKYLRSNHSGNLVPKHFHDAATNFKEKPIEEVKVFKPVPMPQELKNKLRLLTDRFDR